MIVGDTLSMHIIYIYIYSGMLIKFELCPIAQLARHRAELKVARDLVRIRPQLWNQPRGKFEM